MAARSVLALTCAVTLAACAPAEAAPGSRETFRDAFAQRAEEAMPGWAEQKPAGRMSRPGLPQTADV